MSESNTLLQLSYVTLFGLWLASNYVLIPVPVNLIITSTLIVYIGSHRSLKLLLTEEQGGASKDEKEVMTSADAYRFPLVGSCALGSLYLSFKYYKDIANLLLSLYFSLIGVFTLTTTLAPFMSTFIKGII
jgi:minor histocompatibility antigen H13